MAFAVRQVTQESERAGRGLVWTVTNWLHSAHNVAWDGSLMVAVGNNPRFETSPGGLTWSMRALSAGSPVT